MLPGNSDVHRRERSRPHLRLMGCALDRIVVIGGGGHAKVVISVLKKMPCTLLGYTDEKDRGVILGTRYLGCDAVLPDLLRTYGRYQAVVGLGKIDVSEARALLQREIEALGIDFPTIVSPHAVVNDEVTLVPGTVVFDGAVVNSGTHTGSRCILNTNCTVEHDCHLGDNVHIAPGATTSGGVSIGYQLHDRRRRDRGTRRCHLRRLPYWRWIDGRT